MRIAMVGPFGFHPNKTMRSRALPLARVLAGRGHDVKIFMPPWQEPDSADRLWQEAGVDIRYTSVHGGVIGVTSSLVREVVAWKPNILHCFKPKAYSGLVACWFWYFHRRRVHLVVDTDDWEGAGGWNDVAPYNSGQKRFFAWQEKWGMAHCRALTVASRALQTIAWSHGIPSKNVFYLPNGPGIAANGTRPTDKREELGLGDRPTILLYSRLFEFDTSRLADILSQVLTSVPEAAILTVGAGLFEDDTQQLDRKLTNLGLSDHLVHAGWLEEETLPHVLSAADAAVYLMDDSLLNRTKCPVKLADMLSLGLPLVAEAVGQVPEYVIHDRTGLLRPSGDSVGIAADLVRLLQDKDLRTRLGAGAREHIQANFSWERLADVAGAAYQAI